MGLSSSRDNIKSTGYKYSTRGAITISIYDMSVPAKKYELIRETVVLPDDDLLGDIHQTAGQVAGVRGPLRTFHTGGVAGGDITQGLPRVEELFEARKPKKMATLSEIPGGARQTFQ